MNFNKKIRIFALVCALFVLLFTVAAFATDVDAPTENESVVETQQASNKLDQNLHGGDMKFNERLEYALQGTVTGMLMVFAVLGLLWGIVSLSKVFLYDIPNRKNNKSKKQIKNAPVATPAPVAEPTPEIEESQDDGELAAVITAAIAAMLDSAEYKNEFVGGFRVVSFKRSANSAWNKT